MRKQVPRQSTIYFLHFHIIGYINNSTVINEFTLYEYRLILSSRQLSCMYEFNDIHLVTVIIVPFGGNELVSSHNHVVN